MTRRSALAILAAACGAVTVSHRAARAEDVSAPVTLQWFESTYDTIEHRLPDVFAAGYGTIYTPPPGRSGYQSVGYDVYDRFDLGKPGDPTLYGTETGLRTLINGTHASGLSYAIDLVWNHSAFLDGTNTDFYNSGGYPGLNVSLPTDADGDYHPAGASGDYQVRISGLDDIAQEKNYQMIRSPVTAGDPNNIRAGSIAYNGRIANRPDPANARFYPDTSLSPIIVSDPNTGEQNIKIYPFNNANPLAGDAVQENATGYLMRNAQWLVQSLGVDEFRLDATKNYPAWVLNYFDRAVYRESNRRNLDGSQYNVFAFGEFYDGDKSKLQTVVRKDIDPNNPGRIGGNRDTLDFPLFFAMRSNLSNNGLANDWNNVVNASFDTNDDGFNNGSQGVKFVSSHDDDGAYLSSVAYAYTLTMPGNAIVYFNPQQFGTARSGPPNYFPKTGRGDALGGLYGNAITTLVDIRNRYGRGNYVPRLVEKESLAFERDKSMLVLLSNRLDGGFDSRTVQTNFSPGQYLVELTGNATDASADPNNDIAQYVQVKNDKTVDVRFLRNAAPGTGTFTGKGYLIYGLPTPTGTLSLSNVAQTFTGGVPNVAGMTADQTAFANATTRLANVSVIKQNSFNVTLRTNKAVLNLGTSTFHDSDADGDNAVLRIDDGVDVNGSGTVDYRTPGSVVYGFEEFNNKTPGFTSADNNGTYTQSIDATKLSEGYHYVTARAFRHRGDGGPAVYTDFRQSIYVDRLPPVSAYDSNAPWDPANSQNRDFIVKSVDETANSMHFFLNLPANLTDAQIVAMVGSGNHGSQYDRDLFKYGFTGVPSGNNVLTTVTYEPTGTFSVQRFCGISITTTRGAGLGDLNFDNVYSSGDVTGTSYGMEALIYPNGSGQTNTQFNAAADLNGDGKLDSRDLYLQEARFKAVNAPAAAQSAARTAVLRRGNLNGGATDQSDIDLLYTRFGTTTNLWTNDMNVDGSVGQGDVDTLVRTILHSQYGDANLDGKVDLTDFTFLASNFNRTGTAGWATADFSGDRTTDLTDFTMLAANFNWAYAGDAQDAVAAGLGATVPEPSTACIVVTGLCLAAASRRRRGAFCHENRFHLPWAV